MSITVTQSLSLEIVKRLLEVHKAHREWLLVISYLMRQYSSLLIQYTSFVI